MSRVFSRFARRGPVCANGLPERSVPRKLQSQCRGFPTSGTGTLSSPGPPRTTLPNPSESVSGLRYKMTSGVEVNASKKTNSIIVFDTVSSIRSIKSRKLYFSFFDCYSKFTSRQFQKASAHARAHRTPQAVSVTLGQLTTNRSGPAVEWRGYQSRQCA